MESKIAFSPELQTGYNKNEKHETVIIFIISLQTVVNVMPRVIYWKVNVESLVFEKIMGRRSLSIENWS